MDVLGGYQTNFDTNGNKEFEIVYANKGTKDDIENLDVKNKLVLVDINFELPAYEHKSADEIRAVYELHDYLEKFAKTVPNVEGIYKDGISVVSLLEHDQMTFPFLLQVYQHLEMIFKIVIL